MFKVVADNFSLLSDISQVGVFGRFQNTHGSDETQFENHLNVISDINRPYFEREMAQRGDMTTHPSHESLELQSFIDSVRTSLHRHGPLSPHSHLLNAQERERRLDQATSTFQNRVTEFTVNLIMRHESHVSALEGKIQALEERIQALEV
ncbi:unnamed protein product [Rhizoctonia solani]|uniref:Uncharacterized protein n=1 Tax=Rhizoctonia solani TaxID=456999 RepID=A0A8H3BDV9_9AGAM|nr:unnamed protein product [Rhizoctonia solani]